ncbi:uncharacterized protein LOC136072335 [Hydra vulgaris]|uniref:uncharacterized protein LOC136072335 n=1 Tax=Hydra vulgaris TaxID=6087 RepID=UPI0032EA57D7
MIFFTYLDDEAKHFFLKIAIDNLTSFEACSSTIQNNAPYSESAEDLNIDFCVESNSSLHNTSLEDQDCSSKNITLVEEIKEVLGIEKKIPFEEELSVLPITETKKHMEVVVTKDIPLICNNLDNKGSVIIQLNLEKV